MSQTIANFNRRRGRLERALPPLELVRLCLIVADAVNIEFVFDL